MFNQYNQNIKSVLFIFGFYWLNINYGKKLDLKTGTLDTIAKHGPINYEINW